MKYFLFLMFFLFLNIEKHSVNYKCKTNNKLYYFKNVKKEYMYLDKYRFKIEKIGIFSCIKNNCKLQKTLHKKIFFSYGNFFKNCG